jgi:hypothetical protein
MIIVPVVVGIFCGGFLSLAVANELPAPRPYSRSAPVEEEIHQKGSFELYGIFGPFVPAIAASADQADLVTQLWVYNHLGTSVRQHIVAQSRGPPANCATRAS